MPSMMSIFTSLYPDSHQVYDAFKDEMSSRVKTLAEILQIHNYKTGWFAKHNSPHLRPETGFSRGFSFKADLGLQMEGRKTILKWLKKNQEGPFFLAMNVRHTHTPYLPFPEYYKAFSEGQKKLPIETKQDYSEEIYKSLIRKLHDPQSNLYNSIAPEVVAAKSEVFEGGYKPWKLYLLKKLMGPEKQDFLGNLDVVAYFEANNLEDEDNQRALVAHYDACILGIDQEILKPVVLFLKDKGIYDNTMIIVTGDHGESLGEHGIFGHGTRSFEEFIHVPFVMKMPGGDRSRQDIPALIQGIDIMPTILEVAGITVPHTAQGKSLLPLLANPELELNEYVFGENHNIAFVRSSRWKLIVERQAEGELEEEPVLFDLANDPLELKNVKDLNPAVSTKLKMKLDEHLSSLPRYVDKKYEFSPHIDVKTQEKIKKTGYW